MALYDLGKNLYGTPVSYSENVNVHDRTDVFAFDIVGNRLINLYLHNVFTNAKFADANLRLYEDSNGNGVLDGFDTELENATIDGDKTLDYAVTTGKHFVKVERFQPNYIGGPSTVSYDLDLSAIIDVGTLTSNTVSRSETFSAAHPIDTFRFWLDPDGLPIINLNLHDVSAFKNSTLELYRDKGGDTGSLFGAFDDEDTLVASATAGDGHDGLISYRAETGSYYYARVVRGGGHFGSGSYELDMAAVHYPASKLLAGEAVVGDITNYTPNGNGFISNANTTDSYLFSLGSGEGVNIELKGMTDNANMRLVKDVNNNRNVDPFEVIAYSSLGGSTNEYIGNIEEPGEYYLQINQKQEDISTPYTVEFERYDVGPVDDFNTPDDDPFRDPGVVGVLDPGLG